jgi:hypothetical protein
MQAERIIAKPPRRSGRLNDQTCPTLDEIKSSDTAVQLKRKIEAGFEHRREIKSLKVFYPEAVTTDYEDELQLYTTQSAVALTNLNDPYSNTNLRTYLTYNFNYLGVMAWNASADKDPDSVKPPPKEDATWNPANRPLPVTVLELRNVDNPLLQLMEVFYEVAPAADLDSRRRAMRRIYGLRF